MNEIKAVVYTRVSTDKEEQKTSLQFQREHYTKFCEEKGYELVKIYADEGLTGTNSKRKGFLEMLHAAGLDYSSGRSKKLINFDISDREPLFNLIIVKDVSRFSRNIETMRAVKLLKEKGVHILFENNNLNTERDDYEMQLSFHITFAENESRDKSKKMKWSLRHKAEQDKFHFSVLPYGYDYSKETKQYVINEEEAIVVRKMYEMYVNENKGFRSIADYLNANNIPSKKNKGRWLDTTIGRMLASEKYIGNVVVQKYSNGDITGSGSRIINDKDKWKRIENALPAIVDKEVWVKAQQIREERAQVMADNSKRGKKLSEDIFYRKIKCSKCGSHFTRVVSNKIRKGQKVRETTYFCYKRRKYKECDMRGISYNVLERALVRVGKEGVRQRLSSQIEAEQLAAGRLIEILDKKLKNAEVEMRKIREHIENINKQVSNLTDTIANGSSNQLAVQTLIKRINELEEQKINFENELLTFDTIQIEQQKENIRNKLKEIIELNDKNTFTFEEVIEMLDSIVIKENKKFEVRIQSPTLIAHVLAPDKAKEIDGTYSVVTGIFVEYE